MSLAPSHIIESDLDLNDGEGLPDAGSGTSIKNDISP